MQEVQLRQRSAERFGLALPITMEGAECASHDISATGVLLEATVAPALGATVSMTLQYRADDNQQRRMDFSGEVVRVERHGDNYNIAVRLHRPLFQESAPREGGTG